MLHPRFRGYVYSFCPERELYLSKSYVCIYFLNKLFACMVFLRFINLCTHYDITIFIYTIQWMLYKVCSLHVLPANSYCVGRFNLDT